MDMGSDWIGLEFSWVRDCPELGALSKDFLEGGLL